MICVTATIPGCYWSASGHAGQTPVERKAERERGEGEKEGRVGGKEGEKEWRKEREEREGKEKRREGKEKRREEKEERGSNSDLHTMLFWQYNCTVPIPVPVSVHRR